MYSPAKEEHDALLAELAPLPVQGRSWPKAVAFTACAVMLLIGVRLITTAASEVGQLASPYVIAAIVLSYAGLIAMTWYMLFGRTTINHTGIQQQWLMRREIIWDDIRFAKFVPLLFSKRLICFPTRGRPIVFQGGSKELQIAFARISLVYKKRV